MTSMEQHDDVLLSARGVGMAYTRRREGTTLTAIENLDVDIRKGEFVSILGPSGCGKTTFLKIVDGQVRATQGQIMLRGRPLSEAKRERAMVFQEPLLFPWFTVARNVAYGLECQRVPRAAAAQRADTYIDMVGLTSFASHYPHELSGGMQQRANLARALTVDPTLLLMDEPFSALDAMTRELMQQELLRVWEESKRTVLFVTHQIAEAVYLSDRVLVMSGRPGRIVRDVTIDFPRPRPLDIKRTQQFLDYEDEIWHLIESQVRQDFAAEEAPAADDEARPES
jgi:NitT/TauT family transport system ATP-binding protein